MRVSDQQQIRESLKELFSAVSKARYRTLLPNELAACSLRYMNAMALLDNPSLTTIAVGKKLWDTVRSTFNSKS